jgi:hypothetical protein
MKDSSPQVTPQTKYGLSPKFDSAIRLLDLDKHPHSSTFVCTSETEKNGLQDLAQEHLADLLGCGPLCILKEHAAGHGAVDFLAFDSQGLVFLVEVKRAKDQRAKYDVIFQVLKYHCRPAEILDKLSSPKLESKLTESFGLSPQDASKLAEKARKNIERRLMNPVIIVDEASYPLIAYAYSIAFRDIRGELRVFEVNVQHIRDGDDDTTARDFVYIRKYSSNDAWIGNSVKNNRQPTPRDSSLEATLGRIPDPMIGQNVVRLLEKAGLRISPAKSTKNFTLVKFKAYFTWDPSGAFTTGMPAPKLPKPKNPYRVVVTVEDPEVVRRLISAGFYPEKSENGTKTYRIFDLSPSTTDDDLDRLAAVLLELRK